MKSGFHYAVYCLTFFLGGTHVAFAGITFYSDESDWLAALDSAYQFEFTASNMALAEEIPSPPPDDSDVGSPLTFDGTATGLPWSFRIETLEAGASFQWNNPHYGADNSLAVGMHPTYKDDDWEIEILAGTGLFAFAFDLLDSEYVSGESWSIYGLDDTLLGTTSAIPVSLAPAFMGVVSDEPIVFAHFEESATDGEHIGIANFRFGIPEPATLSLLLLGGLVALRRGLKDGGSTFYGLTPVATFLRPAGTGC
ncbi:MAG: PEP-CTERM sorting domain-containing protein [Planctomycetota bacterium]